MIEIVRDFFRFLGVVLLGMDDGGKVFSEHLEMAERYLRWGRERSDPRDFQAVVDNVNRCRDENAPKPEMLLRKYSTFCEGHLGLIACSVARFKRDSSSFSQEKGTLEKEIDAARKAVMDSQKVVDEFEAEGSMIKAKEERARTSELQRRLDRLLQKRDSGEVDSSMNKEYEEIVSRSLHHRGLVEQAVAHMQQLEDVDQQIKASYVNGVLGSLRIRMEEIEALAPPGYSGGSMSQGFDDSAANGSSGEG